MGALARCGQSACQWGGVLLVVSLMIEASQRPVALVVSARLVHSGPHSGRWPADTDRGRSRSGSTSHRTASLPVPSRCARCGRRVCPLCLRCGLRRLGGKSDGGKAGRSLRCNADTDSSKLSTRPTNGNSLSRAAATRWSALVARALRISRCRPARWMVWKLRKTAVPASDRPHSTNPLRSVF